MERAKKRRSGEERFSIYFRMFSRPVMKAEIFNPFFFAWFRRDKQGPLAKFRGKNIFLSDLRIVLRDVAADKGSQVPWMGMGGRSSSREILPCSRGVHGTPQCLPGRSATGRRPTELLFRRDAQGTKIFIIFFSFFRKEINLRIFIFLRNIKFHR